MPDQEFTLTTKLKAVERELAMRRAVYPHQVKAGKMTEHEADRQISIFEAIKADYEEQLADHEPELF